MSKLEVEVDTQEAIYWLLWWNPCGTIIQTLSSNVYYGVDQTLRGTRYSIPGTAKRENQEGSIWEFLTVTVFRDLERVRLDPRKVQDFLLEAGLEETP